MLEFEPGLLIWTTVSFGILVVLLYKVALPPLLAFLSQREKLITDTIAEARLNQKRSEDLLADYRRKLAEANRAADAILKKAREEGRGERAEILEKAGRQAEMILERSRQELAKEKAQIIAEVRGEVAGLVIRAASQVLRREVNPKDNLVIIEEAIKEAKR
jgi:F-type H+-transporting ATPase subunit b